MFLIPYRLDTIYTRFPWFNYAVIALNVLIFFFLVFGVIAVEDADSLILRDWDVSQMIGSTFLHGGLFHLLGNMVFLWVFGNAVAATVGNVAYPFLYLFLGVCASIAHMTFSGEPALGASGAINGVVGMSLILFPVNKLNCWYGFSFPIAGIFWKSGRFKVRAYWLIIAWAVFDVIGLVRGGDNIGHWAHLGGFAAGLLIASGLIYFKLIETYDPTFFDVLAGRPLDRTDYDLNELAAMPSPAPSSGSRIASAKPKVPRAALKSTVGSPGLQGALPDPRPLFHVTSAIPKGNDLLVFFINEGDPIRSVSVVSPVGVVQPVTNLGAREMGTLRLANYAPHPLAGLDLNLSFLHGAEQKTESFHFDEASQSFIET